MKVVERSLRQTVHKCVEVSDRLGAMRKRVIRRPQRLFPEKSDRVLNLGVLACRRHHKLLVRSFTVALLQDEASGTPVTATDAPVIQAYLHRLIRGLLIEALQELIYSLAADHVV